MNNPFKQHKKSDIQWTLDRQKERIQITLRLAFNYLNDPDKRNRRLENYCVVCYYRESTIAGSAMTFSHCGLCAKEMSWSSTHQEKLCHACAIKWNLCRECGTTLDLTEPRSIKKEIFDAPESQPDSEETK